MTKWISAALAVLTIGLFAGTAQAGVLDPYLENGTNLLEDDSGELVLRFDHQLQEYLFVDAGQLQQGDIVISVFDISWVNQSANTLEPGGEVTGVMAMEIASITDVNGAFPFTTGDIEFAAVDPLLTSALLGVAAAPGDVAFFFDDPGNDLNISTDDPLSAIANATNGTLVMTAALFAPQDYLQGNDVVLDLEGYSSLTGVPGVSVRGSYEGGLSVSYYNLPGTLSPGAMCPLGQFGDCHDMVLSGDLLVSDLAGFDIQNDAQFSFAREGDSTGEPPAVPAPAALGFLGLGLAGLGLTRRRRTA